MILISLLHTLPATKHFLFLVNFSKSGINLSSFNVLITVVNLESPDSITFLMEYLLSNNLDSLS